MTLPADALAWAASCAVALVVVVLTGVLCSWWDT